jgi:hypothetical protein
LPHRAARRGLLPVCAFVVGIAAMLFGDLPSAGAAGEADADVLRALHAVDDLRLRIDPSSEATENSWQRSTTHGRPVLQIEGRAASGGSADTRRLEAIFDLGVGRVTSFLWFPHGSARKAGEAIVSLSEVSSRADAHLRKILPGVEFALAGIERQRASGEEGVYYEASFADAASEVPFLRPPVRLLLDASTGNVYRFDADAEWFVPPKLPSAHLSRRAAERVAAVVLGSRDLSEALGAGARLGKVAPAELFVVRPNGWLGSPGAENGGQASVAWVVPFSLAADASRPVHRLFVDAGTGRILGGLPGPR